MKYRATWIGSLFHTTVSHSSWKPVHFHEICLAIRVWYFNPESVSIVSLASDQVWSCLGL